MNLPNKLTMLRVFMVPIFIVALMGDFFEEPMNRYIAVVIFILASLTDALDGYIARSQNLVTNFGKFMDPVADKLLVSAALICMVQMHDLSAWVVILIISREFIVTAFRLVASLDNLVIAASNTAKFKTIFQMIMVICVLLGFQNTWYLLLCDIMIWLSVIFTVVSAAEYIMKNKSIFKDSM